MHFSSVEEAKNYVVAVTNKARTPEQINSALAYYQDMIDSSQDTDSKKLWEYEHHTLKEWSNSTDFNMGNFPQGIDELVLEAIEWRSMVYAFQNIETKTNPFTESGFYAQWYLGAIYGIFTIVGKLLSKDKRDNSLRRLWTLTSPTMLLDGACTEQEVEFLNATLNTSSGHFTNENSKTLLYRNKLIAHNESMPIVKWDEVDEDLAILIRMWSLLIAWSSFGIFNPFRTDKQAFLGLESMYQADEIEALKEQRRIYISKVHAWSKAFAHTGLADSGRGAFSAMSVNFNIAKPHDLTPKD